MRSLEVLTQAEDGLRLSPEPRFHLEMALLKIAQLRRLASFEELLERFESLASGRPPRPPLQTRQTQRERSAIPRLRSGRRWPRRAPEAEAAPPPVPSPAVTVPEDQGDARRSSSGTGSKRESRCSTRSYRAITAPRLRPAGCGSSSSRSKGCSRSSSGKSLCWLFSRSRSSAVFGRKLAISVEVDRERRPKPEAGSPEPVEPAKAARPGEGGSRSARSRTRW